jgi:phage shock protein B
MNPMILSILGLDPGSLAIIMVFAIPLTAIIGGLAIKALEIMRQGGDRATGRAIQEETRLVQQMHEMLLKMEERIETLETILIERERDRREVRQ